MGSPHRPVFRPQLNDPTTTLDSENCSAAAGAMALDRATLGKIRVYGGEVRTRTGDRSGGLNLRQVQQALATWGVKLDVWFGDPGTLALLENALYEGRGATVSGSSSATKGTRWQASETFAGNHQIWINEGRGWHKDAKGNWYADEYLVYDPLADGRRPTIAQSPFWLPRSRLLLFLSRLDVGGGRLGSGRAYMGLTRDTEPHAHFRFGGVATKPFPDRTRASVSGGRKVNVRSGPSTNYPIVDRLPHGTLFVAYQKTTTGSPLVGSRVWYGSHDGDRWVHESGLSHKGGTT